MLAGFGWLFNSQPVKQLRQVPTSALVWFLRLDGPFWCQSLHTVYYWLLFWCSLALAMPPGQGPLIEQGVILTEEPKAGISRYVGASAGKRKIEVMRYQDVLSRYLRVAKGEQVGGIYFREMIQVLNNPLHWASIFLVNTEYGQYLKSTLLKYFLHLTDLITGLRESSGPQQ